MIVCVCVGVCMCVDVRVLVRWLRCVCVCLWLCLYGDCLCLQDCMHNFECVCLYCGCVVFVCVSGHV